MPISIRSIAQRTVAVVTIVALVALIVVTTLAMVGCNLNSYDASEDKKINEQLEKEYAERAAKRERETDLKLMGDRVYDAHNVESLRSVLMP